MQLPNLISFGTVDCRWRRREKALPITIDQAHDMASSVFTRTIQFVFDLTSICNLADTSFRLEVDDGLSVLLC